jgi:hypothetical protein
MNEKKDKTAGLVKAKDLLISETTGIEIKTPKDLKAAADILFEIKSYLNAVSDYWDPLCKNAYDGWKALTSRRKEFLDPAEKAEKDVKLKIGRYHEAERDRQAKELKKRQEAERKAAEEKRLAQVEEMQDMGELEQADHLATQPLDITPVAAPKKTEVDGVSVSYRYSAQVVNLPEFLAFVIENQRFLYLVKDFPTKELNKLATAQKEMFDFPGVELLKKPVTSVRG